MLTNRERKTAYRRLKKAVREVYDIEKFYKDMQKAYDLWSSKDKEKQAEGLHMAGVLAFSLYGSIYISEGLY